MKCVACHFFVIIWFLIYVINDCACNAGLSKTRWVKWTAMWFSQESEGQELWGSCDQSWKTSLDLCEEQWPQQRSWKCGPTQTSKYQHYTQSWWAWDFCSDIQQYVAAYWNISLKPCAEHLHLIIHLSMQNAPNVTLYSKDAQSYVSCTYK